MEGGSRNPFDYEPEVPNLEALSLFLKDIKQLEESDRQLLLDVASGDRLGMLTIAIKDEAEKKVSIGPDMDENDRINGVLDAVEELVPMLQPDDVMEALGQEKDRIRATFTPYQ